MNDHEEFSDEEATVFSECEDREAQMRKAKLCSDPWLRELALAALAEETIQSAAMFAGELLDKADAGELQLTDGLSEALIDGAGIGVDRPDWYRPGDRVVLPEDD
jgi:hypothetical protein